MRLKSIAKWLLAVVLTLVVLLPLLVFTQMGNRLLVTGLNILPFLKIDFEQGHLLSDASFKQIELDLDVIVIRIEGLDYSLQARCLAISQLCMRTVKARGIYIDMPELPEEPEDEDDTSTERIVLPIDLLIDNIDVESFTFNQSAVKLSASQISASFKARSSHFLVSDAQIERLDVAIRDDSEGGVNHTKADDASKTSAKPTAQQSSEASWPLAQLPDVFLPIDLQVDELLLGHLSLKLSPDPEQIAPINSNNLTLTARWSGFLLDVDTIELIAPDYGQAGIKGHMDWRYPWGLELVVNSAIDNFPWYKQLQGSKQRINVSGDFSKLSVQLISEGPFDVAADVQTDLVDNKLPFTANLQSSKVDLQPIIEQPLLLESLKSQVSGNLYQQQINAQLDLQGFGYQQGTLNVTGTHHNKIIDLSSFRFEDAISGSLATGQLNLEYGTDIIVKLDANVPGLTLPEMTLGATPIDGRIKGQVHLLGKLDMNQLPKSLEQPGKWQLSSYNTNIDGTINDQPAALFANFSLDQSLTLKGAVINARFQDAQLDLKGHSDENWHVTGTWHGAQFQRWHPQLKGNLSGDIAINGALLDPNIVLDANVSDLQYQGTNVAHTDIDVSYWPVRNHQVKVNVASDEAMIENHQLSQIIATVQGDLENQALTLDANGDFPVHLIVENTLDLDNLTSQLEVQEAHLGYLDYRWTLQSGFGSAINIREQDVSLAAHCWQQSDNEICVTEPAKLAQDGNISLRWQLHLGDYDQLLLGRNLEIDSGMSGSANASWQAMQLLEINLENNIDAGTLTLKGEEKSSTLLTWSQGKISALADSSQANVDLFLDQQDNTRLISGNVNIALDQGTMPMQGNLDIERFEIHLIEELVPGMSRARGILAAAVDFSGSVTSPILSGNVSLHGGELATFQSPNSIDDINLDLTFKGQSADVDGGFMIKQHPGEISAEIDWSDGLQANARLFTDKIPVLYPPNLDAMVATDIRLEVSGQHAKIGGDIMVLEGLLKLEDLPEGSIQVSEDAVIVDTSGKQVEKEKTMAIVSDVDLSIDPKFRLDGQGFTGNLGGKLKIRQEKFQPVQLFGVLKIANGKYKAYGQNLDVQSGEITFVGSPSNPTINVKAVREIKDENVTAGLSIIGPTDALTLTFFSNPSMQQPEILSYLTRGRGLDSDSGGGAALGVALASALTKTTPMQNVVQKVPLLTDVSLDTEVDGDVTQATISGYLGERIFLKYGIGVYEPINELTVRLYLMSRLWLETVSGLENSADIYYSFEVD
ncbi:translocation/assembly module TamB domain-containing protein [Thalassotalea litorea]|uniref:translocation/assembly module TamB domain-containing protein n=1 Tax=Thalassotalea litorea TaxID=2020715 RepID=UPI00373534E5